MQPHRGRRRHTSGRVAPYPLLPDLPHDQACERAIEELLPNIEGFHDFSLELHGGRPGVRDQDRLEAAVSQPFMSVGGEPAYPSGLDQAAVLLYLIDHGQPFIEGNKRTAYLATLFFLEQCGYWRYEPFLNKVETSDLRRLIETVANERVDLEAGRIKQAYTNEEIAHRLDRILAGSRNRPLSLRRARSGAYRTFWQLLDR